MTTGLPIVDFANFLDGTDEKKVASQIVTAFTDSGLLYLVNHGITQERIDAIFAISKQFFDLPLDVKKLAPHPESATYHRGYSSPGREKLTQHIYDTQKVAQLRAETAEVKESFESGSEDNQSLPNIWLPDDVLPGFREACLEFYATCRALQFSILRAIAIGLGLSEDHLLPYHAKNENQLRLLRYPSVPVSDIEKGTITRAGAHSDFGCFTLLFQDDVGGLQYEDHGKFHDVPPIPGAIVINGADLLSRWTNGKFKSPVHRVSCPISQRWPDGMTPERYSVPYFCGIDSDALIDCLPGTWDSSTPKVYEPIIAGEYIAKRLSPNY